MCAIDYQAPSLYHSTIRKARKEHRCGECYRQIQKGEKYQHVAGVWEGHFNTHKTCSHCLSGQNLLMDQCNGFLHEGIQEDLTDHLYEELPWASYAARIVVGMRRKWQRFDAKGLMKIPNAKRVSTSGG